MFAALLKGFSSALSIVSLAPKRPASNNSLSLALSSLPAESAKKLLSLASLLSLLPPPQQDRIALKLLALPQDRFEKALTFFSFLTSHCAATPYSCASV